MCSFRDVLEVFGGFRPSFWGLEDPGEREYATCATSRRCFGGPDVFGLSPQVRMCSLRDVLEVSGGSPSENVVYARRFGGVRGILAKARMCRLRDVWEVFRRRSRCVEVRLSLQVRMCGLRDVLEVFGDFRPSVLGLGRSVGMRLPLQARICRLRDVSEVFL